MNLTMYSTKTFHDRVFAPLSHECALKGIDCTTLMPEEDNCFGSIKIDKVIKYLNKNEINNIINKSSNGLWIQCGAGFKNTLSALKKQNMKRIFVSHGIWAETKENVDIFKTPVYKQMDGNFDKIYVASDCNKEMFIKYSNISKDKIISGYLPQLDLLGCKNNLLIKDREYCDVEAKINIKKFDKVVLYIIGKVIYPQHFNVSRYLQTINYLIKIAEDNNILVLIKSKLSEEETIKFFACNKMNYGGIKEGSNIIILNHKDNWYKFYKIIDTILINDVSTLEIESCIAKKPLIICNDKNKYNDPFGVVSGNVAIFTNNVEDLVGIIKTHNQSITLEENQRKVCIAHGIKEESSKGIIETLEL